MKLLIITPTLGRSPYFAGMLQSLAGIQADVRHVLVCPVSTASAVGALAPSAEIVRQTGSGLYAALNEGLAAGGTDWDAFTWINDDDQLASAGINRLIKLLEQEPNLAAAYGGVDLIDRHGRRLAKIPVARWSADLGPLLAAGLVPLAQPGTLVRRSAALSVNGFDPTYTAAGDMDYFRRLLEAGRQFGFANIAVAAFRVHGGQISKRTETVASEAARVFGEAQRNAAWLAEAPVARRRFKRNNFGVYLERLLRHGPVTMEELYARE